MSINIVDVEIYCDENGLGMKITNDEIGEEDKE
jgi:hypothetical protein